MTSSTTKFDKVHSTCIRLSERRTTAYFNGGGTGISFTERLLAPKKCLVLMFASESDASWIRFGFTETSPATLEREHHEYLEAAIGEDSLMHSRWRGKGGYMIHLDEATHRVMITTLMGTTEELCPGRSATESSYICFTFSGMGSSLKICSTMNFDAFRILEGAVCRAIRFSTSPLSVVKLQGTCSVSDDNMSSRGNFALINTPLRPGHALSVVLSELKREEPIRIILTTESAHRAYSSNSLEELCQTTYSLEMESEVPEANDMLGVWISPTGGVYISHNFCDWLERAHVDPDLEYRVIFGMENVRELAAIGIMRWMLTERPKSMPEVPEPRENDSRECAVCLGERREVVVMPCFHYALCAYCARILQESRQPCPICRTEIVHIQKLHIP